MRLSYCCCIFNHLFMPTVSVANMLVKEPYPHVSGYNFLKTEGFFGPNSAFRSHINGVFVQRIRWFYVQSTRIGLFLENGEIYRPFFAKSKRLREAY